jgi:hypothetical protein
MVCLVLYDEIVIRLDLILSEETSLNNDLIASSTSSFLVDMGTWVCEGLV